MTQSNHLLRDLVGIGTSELIVIFIVVLVLFGPEQLPGLARNLGKLAAQLRKTSDSVRREFYNSIYTPGQEVRKSLNGEIETLRSLKVEVLAPPIGAVGAPSKPNSSETQLPADEKTPGKDESTTSAA